MHGSRYRQGFERPLSGRNIGLRRRRQGRGPGRVSLDRVPGRLRWPVSLPWWCRGHRRRQGRGPVSPDSPRFDAGAKLHGPIFRGPVVPGPVQTFVVGQPRKPSQTVFRLAAGNRPAASASGRPVRGRNRSGRHPLWRASMHGSRYRQGFERPLSGRNIGLRRRRQGRGPGLPGPSPRTPRRPSLSRLPGVEAIDARPSGRSPLDRVPGTRPGPRPQPCRKLPGAKRPSARSGPWWWRGSMRRPGPVSRPSTAPGPGRSPRSPRQAVFGAGLPGPGRRRSPKQHRLIVLPSTRT